MYCPSFGFIFKYLILLRLLITSKPIFAASSKIFFWKKIIEQFVRNIERIKFERINALVNIGKNIFIKCIFTVHILSARWSSAQCRCKYKGYCSTCFPGGLRPSGKTN